MFSSQRQCAELNYADSRSRLQLEVTSLSFEFRVYSISLIPLEGFPLNFGQIFTSVRWCAELITHPCLPSPSPKAQGHSWSSQVKALNFITPPYLYYPWNVILLSLVKCSPPWPNHAVPRLRSQLKVMGSGLEFHVPSISPLTLGRIFIALESNVCLT